MKPNWAFINIRTATANREKVISCKTSQIVRATILFAFNSEKLMIRATAAIIKYERISILNVQLIKAISVTFMHQNLKHVLLKSAKISHMSNPKGIFFSSNKYILVVWVNIAPWNILGKNKKTTCYSFFQGMFQLVQCPPLTVQHQGNVQALSFCQKN